jgi:hypothetical protein
MCWRYAVYKGPLFTGYKEILLGSTEKKASNRKRGAVTQGVCLVCVPQAGEQTERCPCDSTAQQKVLAGGQEACTVRTIETKKANRSLDGMDGFSPQRCGGCVQRIETEGYVHAHRYGARVSPVSSCVRPGRHCMPVGNRTYRSIDSMERNPQRPLCVINLLLDRWRSATASSMLHKFQRMPNGMCVPLYGLPSWVWTFGTLVLCTL